MSMVSIVFGGFIVTYSPKIEALYTPKTQARTEMTQTVDSLKVNSEQGLGEK